MTTGTPMITNATGTPIINARGVRRVVSSERESFGAACACASCGGGVERDGFVFLVRRSTASSGGCAGPEGSGRCAFDLRGSSAFFPDTGGFEGEVVLAASAAAP